MTRIVVKYRYNATVKKRIINGSAMEKIIFENEVFYFNKGVIYDSRSLEVPKIVATNLIKKGTEWCLFLIKRLIVAKEVRAICFKRFSSYASIVF